VAAALKGHTGSKPSAFGMAGEVPNALIHAGRNVSSQAYGLDAMLPDRSSCSNAGTVLRHLSLSGTSVLSSAGHLDQEAKCLVCV
jgi:hypothetical protein